MKKIFQFTAFAIFGVMVACSSPKQEVAETSFGQPIDTAIAVTADQALALLDSSDAAPCTISGTVTEVCQAEGCWLKLGLADGSGLLVLMKEHSFSVPKSMNGKSVFVGGVITRDTTSVATLQEYAKEDGKSAAEIAAITAPEIKPVVEPVGIVIR